MIDREFTDDEIIKALDICDKFDFFYGQRAGRELWFEKPVEVQNEDIRNFADGIAFVKDFINRQKSEIESLQSALERAIYNDLKADEEIAYLKAEIEELSQTNKTLADTLIGRLNITVNIPEVEFKYMFPHHTCKRFKKGEAKAVKEFADNVLQELWQMNWHYGQLPCSEEDKTTQRAIKKCIEVVKRKTKEMTEGNNE